jgi:2-polyprenyl-3-methyl-5-hydroxy-6-metoxy-1,4-benzoquinol methylase
MTRSESEKIIAPLILKCQDFIEDRDKTLPVSLPTIRPDVRRVSLILSLARTLLGESATGNGLEVGSGYGYLLFPMAVLLPGIRWTAIDHPERTYLQCEAYLQTFREHNCSLATVDIVREPLPFPDAHFSLVTFSEVLEHLPVERVNFVLSELARVVHPGGILIASSPNQASLENLIRLLKGKSILEMPDEMHHAKETFGHIRLYTVAEVSSAMLKRGFSVELSVVESNNAGYRGTSDSSWRRRAHRMYEQLEGRIAALRPMGDNWYMAFRKTASN